MALRSTFNLSSLTSPHISFAQIATFGLFSKTTSDITSSLMCNLIPQEKTRRVVSHVIGSALAYGISLNLPTRSWIPQPLSIPVALSMALSLYLFSSNLFSNKATQVQSTSPNPQIKKLQDELSAVKKAGVSQAKEQDLQPRIDALKKQLADSEKQKEKFQKEAEGHLAQLRARDSKIGTLQGDLEAAEKAGADQTKEKELQQKIDTLKKQLADAEKEKLKLQKEAEEHLAKLQVRDSKIGTLQGDLEAAKKASASQGKEKELEIDRLKQNLRTAQDENQAFRDSEARLLSQLQSEAAKLKQFDQLITELEKQKQSLGATQNDELASAQRQLKTSETTYAALKEKYDALQSDQTELRSASSGWKAELVKKEKEINGLNAKVKELEAKNSQIKDLQEKLRTAQEEAAQHRKQPQQETSTDELASTQRQLQASRASHAALKDRCDALQAEIAELNAKIKELEAKNSQVKDPQEKLRTAQEGAVQHRKQQEKSTVVPSALPKLTPSSALPVRNDGAIRSLTESPTHKRRPSEITINIPHLPSVAEATTSGSRRAKSAERPPRNALQWIEQLCRDEGVKAPESFTSPEWMTGLPLAVVIKAFTQAKINIQSLKPENGPKTIEFALQMAKNKGFSESLVASEVGVNAQKMEKYFEKMYSQLNSATQPTPSPYQTLDALIKRLKEIVNESPEKLRNIPARPTKDITGTEVLSLWINVLSTFNGIVAPLSFATLNEKSWTGFELCAIIAIFRPDLIDLGKLNPNDRVTNIRLGMEAFEKATGETSTMVADDYGFEKLSMITFYQRIQLNLDPDKAIMREILDLARR